MGVFEKIFKKPKELKKINGYFATLDGYAPVWSTYEGGLYEMELTRACVHTFASHCSKLQPNVEGADLHKILSLLETKPNPFMTSAQFLYKVAAIYETQPSCYIVPIMDAFGRINGYYPVMPSMAEVIDVDGEPWLRYTFPNGEKAAIEFYNVGLMSKYFYKSDFRGEGNAALMPTIQLLHTQDQGIVEGIKNNASFRFMANIANFSKGSDLAKERKKWVADNLGTDGGGLALFPNTYTNVQQIQSVAKVVDPEQMKLIQERVYTYFGTNEDILQNKAVGDKWSGYYEGKIESFAIQLSQAMTCMTYSTAELRRKNAIIWTANRLQYMTNADKLQVSSQMFDRGILSINDVMDIWQLPHVEGGDKRYIRKEYTEISQLDQVAQLQEQLTATQNQLNAKKNTPLPEDPQETPEEPDKKEDESIDPDRKN